MKKKLCCIILLIILLLNSSVMLIVSEAIDAIQTATEKNEEKIKALAEFNLTKYENFDTTTENSDTGRKGTLVQFNLKTGIEFAQDETYMPIKKTSINIDLPWIGDYKPERVEVITKSTKATNGGKDASYEYHSSTGILEIRTENNEYAENVPDARDEYEIICIYNSKCYAESETRDLKIRANVEENLNNDEETRISTTAEGNYNVTENIGNVISVEQQTDDIYDGYITANKMNSENQYETVYNEISKIMISDKDLVQKIEIKETSDTALYTETSIDKNQVLEMLGDEGNIEISDETGNVLSTINKDTETDENGKIKVEYTNKTNTLFLRLNKMVKEGIIEITNKRVIIPTAEIIDNTIPTNIAVNGINEITDEISKDNSKKDIIKYEYSQPVLTQIKQATSNIDTKLSTETLVNNTTNDVILTATLVTKDAKDSLFKNPYVSIEMPQEVTKVQLGTTEIMYDNQAFNLVNSSVNVNDAGNKVINIQLNGCQTAYGNGTVLDGATIRIPMTVTLTKSMESKVGIIKTICSNEITNSTGNKETEVTLLNKIVNAVPDNYITNVENNSNKTQVGENAVYEQNGIKAEMIEEIGNTTISDGGTVYEQQIIKQNIKVTNTSNSNQKVSVTINVPDEMVYVIKRDNDGFVYHEDKNYYEPNLKYEYEDQEEKQVTWQMDLKARETKTDFIELKVKDLADSEEEKQANIKCNIKINNVEITQLNIKNIIKQAEVSVELKCVLGNERDEWNFVLQIKNLTNRELKNENVVFQASDMYDLNSVDLGDGTIIENLSGNIWSYTIDSLQVGEGKYYLLEGKINDIPENENNRYEINGVATVYGEDIQKYESNKARMTGYIEAVEVEMSANKEKVKMDEEITYTVNIKNTGKTWNGFAIYTEVNAKDVIPRELQPISITYNEFTINREAVKDDDGNDLGYISQTFSEEQVTKDISELEIPDGYDEEDAPNIDLQLTIPEGKTVTMTIKAKAKMITENTDITNTINVTGEWIKAKKASVKTTILKYDYVEEPDNPDNPDTPVNPDDPNNPNNPNNPDNPTNEKITISGIAWVDENEDGKRTTNEKTYNNMPVMLYDYNNGTLVKENGQAKKIMTNSNGEYEFSNIEKGKYIVIFLYDTGTYTLTDYQKDGVIESKNSDAITKTIGINGEKVTAGLTDTLTADKNLTNIDIGLVENKNFDLGIEKYVSKITVQTPDGKTKVYDYNNKQFAKVEIHSKKINGATVIIEYKMVITNKGELAGKAVQVVDKLPEGLTFKSELNSDWYERNESLYTNSLSGQDINVGESKEVTLVLTKNVNSSNVGTINNTAEIGISSNNKAVEDKNNDNNTSNAQVLIAVSTGLAKTLGITIGMILILVLIAIILFKNRKMLKSVLFVSVLVICVAGNASQVFGLTIHGNNMHYDHNSTGATGSDGRHYECYDHGKPFCDRQHAASLYTSGTTTVSTGNWSSNAPGNLNLSSNTNKSNVVFTKIDDNFNKLGPFKVNSSITGARANITTYYKDENGKTASKGFDIINWGWGNEFYIKVPNSVTEVTKITISASYSTTRVRYITKKKYEIYNTSAYKSYNNSTKDPYGGSNSTYDPNCYGKTTQKMRWDGTEYQEKQEESISRSGSIDITGPWTPTGDLEIKKVDSDDSNIVLKNTEFKLLSGKNTSLEKALIISKDGSQIPRIVVEKSIEFNQKAGVFGTVPVNTSSVTIDGVSGYTATFSTSLDKGTTLVTNTEGKVSIKNLLYGEYTFVETANRNYGYTKMVTTSINGFTPLSETTWTIKNEKQIGEIHIKKIDDRVSSKILPGVEFVLKSSNNEGYIKVKGTGNNITLDDYEEWVTKAVGTITLNDQDENSRNPTIGYTTNINEATRFVTDSNAEISIQNLLISSNGTDIIKYKFEEVANPNYGYLADTDRYKNYNVTYSGNEVTNDGWITPTIKNTVNATIKNHQEYIRLEGYVWEELSNSKDNTINNLYDQDVDALVGGLKVFLYRDNNLIAQTVTNSDGWYGFGSRKEDGEAYTNQDYFVLPNGNLRIDDLSKYEVEIEYDGLRFKSIEVGERLNYIVDESDNRVSRLLENYDRGTKDRRSRVCVNEDFTTIANNRAQNSKGEKTYDLSYNQNNHVSTYIDKWGYKYDENKTRLQVTQPTEKEAYQIIASLGYAGYSLNNLWSSNCESKGLDTLKGLNLGLIRREQPDLAISADIDSASIRVGDYENEYTYGKRSDYQNNEENDGFGVDVKFGTALGSYSSRGLNLYTRRVYKSDLAYYYNNQDTDFMQMYVTYKIRIKNQSAKLTATVNELVDYYDRRYNVEDSWVVDGEQTTQIGASSWSKTSGYQDDNYQVVYTLSLSDTKIKPKGYVDIYIKFRLQSNAIKALIQSQTTLNNVSEITSYSTIVNEDGTWKSYAGIDEDSNPGNAEIKLIENKEESGDENYKIENKTLDTKTFEDDTDYAPSFIIGIEESEPTRGLSGTVFEDENAKFNDNETHMAEERVGDGILTDSVGTRRVDNNRIKGVKVELLNKDGSLAKLYQPSIENRKVTITESDAITETDEHGDFKFLGVIPGQYLIRYTYDGNSSIVDSSGNVLVESINVRDYKSTIITSDLIKEAMNIGSSSEREGNLNWILTFDAKPQNNRGKGTNEEQSKKNEIRLIRYSGAIDDIAKRNEVDDVYYETYGQNLQMTADTAYFDVGVEFSNVEGFDKKVTYTDYKDEYVVQSDKIVAIENGRIKLVNNYYAVNPYQDFGIIERARQDYKVNKRISNLRITLANGQVLINGNPYRQMPDVITDLSDTWNNLETTADESLQYTKALPGQVNVEMDSELLQGAQLTIEYTISIKNESEVDYEYMDNPKYYYYGDSSGINRAETVIKKVVDYMDDNIIYNDTANEKMKWQKVTADELKEWNDEDGITKKLISDEVYNGINSGYTIAVTDYFYNNVVKVGEIGSTKIYGSKLLSNKESGTTITNNAEILETKGIRSLWSSTPGNYNPASNGGSPHEPDDDKTILTITPPTGLTDNRVVIISITTISLVVLAGGVYLIRKKVL